MPSFFLDPCLYLSFFSLSVFSLSFPLFSVILSLSPSHFLSLCAPLPFFLTFFLFPFTLFFCLSLLASSFLSAFCFSSLVLSPPLLFLFLSVSLFPFLSLCLLQYFPFLSVPFNTSSFSLPPLHFSFSLFSSIHILSLYPILPSIFLSASLFVFVSLPLPLPSFLPF